MRANLAIIIIQVLNIFGCVSVKSNQYFRTGRHTVHRSVIALKQQRTTVIIYISQERDNAINTMYILN